jgi:hypothetical protein
MIALMRIVEYLRSHGVGFRLLSFPSPESKPAVAFPIQPSGLLVESSVVIVDGRVGIACVSPGTKVNLPGLGAELHTDIVREGRLEDLPWPFSFARAVPPFGRAVGAPVFMDERFQGAPLLAFPLTETDIVELTFDDYARLEQPRLSRLAEAGELPAASVH